MEQKKKCQKCGQEFLSPNETDSACPKCLFEFVMGKTDNSGSDNAVKPEKMTADEPVLPAGTKLGQYEIKEMLGRGGMGTVYKAYHSSLERFVAIKILPAKLATDQEFLTRFNREAKALAGLSHPNIVSIYDICQDKGYFYFVMEFVEGVTARQLIEEHTLSPEAALKIVPQLCDALEYAHSEGVVHRDIKPENILMDKKGRVKIADFGLARIVRGDISIDPVTKTQEVMGTFDYMAPEQRMKSKDVDHRVDIYSLGVVFYEMLTGELPIGKFELPSHKVQIDVRVDDIVMKTLEREPQRRYQRASEVGQAVSAIITGIPLPESAQVKKPIIPIPPDLRATLAGISAFVLSIIGIGIAFPDEITTIGIMIMILIVGCVSDSVVIALGLFTRKQFRKGHGNKWAFTLANIGIIMAVVGLFGIMMIIFALSIPKFELRELAFAFLIGGTGYVIIFIGIIYILRALFIGQEISIPTKVMFEGPPRYSTLAILSLILAFVPACITQILGVIFGIVAIRKINRSAGQLKGMGLAIAGIVISIIVGTTIVPIILAIAIPNFMRGKSMAAYQNEERAPEVLEKLALAQELYRRADLDGNSQDDYCHSVKALVETKGLNEVIFGAGSTTNKGSYEYSTFVESGSGSYSITKDDRLTASADKGSLGPQAKPYLGYFYRFISPVIPPDSDTFTFVAYPDGPSPLKTFLIDDRGIIYSKQLSDPEYLDKWNTYTFNVSDASGNRVGYDPIITGGWTREKRVELGEELVQTFYQRIRKVRPDLPEKLLSRAEKKSDQVEINKRMEDKKQQLAQSLEVAQTIKDERKQSEIICYIALQYAELGEYTQSIEITKPITDLWKSQALQEITRKYTQSGQKSVDILNKSLEVAQTIKDERKQSETICYISIRYAEIGEYDKAIEITKLISDDQWKSQALGSINRIRIKNK